MTDRAAAFDSAAARPAEHFESIERQAHAARLGMWLFLASELLFFAGLFALYVGYRTEHPAGFASGVQHNTLIYGSVNTVVLLVSSYTVALAVHALRRGERRRASRLVALTVTLGLCFLCIKSAEYAAHFREGIYPAGRGRFFSDHRTPGLSMFFTLYFGMTGLHAVHVFVGMCALSVLGIRVARGRIGAGAPHPLVVGAIYWHLVDVIWIFLWPLFYLLPAGGR